MLTTSKGREQLRNVQKVEKAGAKRAKLLVFFGFNNRICDIFVTVAVAAAFAL